MKLSDREQLQQDLPEPMLSSERGGFPMLDTSADAVTDFVRAPTAIKKRPPLLGLIR